MAKKEETPNIVDSFSEFKELKSIDKATMIKVLEDSFRKTLSNIYGSGDQFDVIMNPDKGDIQIFQNFEVVPDGEVTDPKTQISLSDARADNDPEAEVGEEHSREIHIADFGRRAIVNLRQTLSSRILELQKENIVKKYKGLEGELITAEVYQAWSRETLLSDDEKTELILPKSETIPGDYFRKGDTIRAVIKEVQESKGNPRVIVSRTSKDFLRRLFELEVPEIHDGLINIRAIARIPGERAKIAVESFDDRIDPVGACVGVKGSRIHGIVRELHNENIDVITYTSNPKLLIERALSPATVSQTILGEGENGKKKAEVYLKPEEVSKAIGKGGLNIKLASELTGYTIEVFRDNETEYENDIYLDEFKDEIDDWVIDQIKDCGILTAQAVLNTPRQEIIDRADLEEDTVDNLIAVLKAEYEEDATPDNA